MSTKAKCGRVRGWMADAATGSLSETRRGEFEKHIGDCAGCRAEFARMENLLGRIEQNLSAEFSVEPSSRLLANVRQSITAEPQHSTSWVGGHRRFAAAVACTAFASVLLAVIVLQRTNQPTRHYVSHTPVAGSASARIPVPPARVTAVPGDSTSAENVPPRVTAHARSSKPRFAVARQELPPNPRRHNTEPEVIVQPGQMQAILQFVAAARKGQIDAAKALANKQQDAQPLVITPLNTAPLKIAALDADSVRDAVHQSTRDEGTRR